MRGLFPTPVRMVQLAVIAAVGLQVTAAIVRPKPAAPPDLDAAVPARLADWTVTPEPLGSTPEASAWVADTLNFDRAVQRTYVRGGERFTIFAAWWSRGKMPARAVAIHTPDCCWSDAGYACLAMKFRQTLPVSGARLQPGEWRVFRSPEGDTLHTMFWQIVAGKAFDFGGRFNGAGAFWPGVKAFFGDAVLGCREQLFVTVTANVPIERLETDAGFQTALRGLAAAGLGETTGGG